MKFYLHLIVDKKLINNRRAKKTMYPFTGNITLASRPTVAKCCEVFRLSVKGRRFLCPKERNKGKAGLILEGLLGIPTSSACLDCQDGEIKAFPQIKAGHRCRLATSGEYYPKETVAVTMMKPSDLPNISWEDSRVRKKLSRTLFIAYVRDEDHIEFHEEKLFSKEHELFAQLAIDYATIQAYFAEHNETSGKIGKLLQVRTKGPGGDKKSHAFYLRKQFMIALFKD